MHSVAITFFTGALVLTAGAMPYNNITRSRLLPRDTTFNLNVWNNCPWSKMVALYSVDTDTWTMEQRSTPTNIPSGGEYTIAAPFFSEGMRLSGHAEWGTDGQWQSQALFEFSYSSYGGKDGTAYDVSIMEGSDWNIGLGAYVIDNGQGSASCRDQTCFPWYCPPDQGWTNPDQVNIGSPADTTCYFGPTDFKIVFCP